MDDVPRRTRSVPSYRIVADRDKKAHRYLSACFRALSFVLGKVWRISFGWWLDPISQRRKNQALWNDVQANLYFLYSGGQPIIETHPNIQPFDYASVRISYGNVLYCFTRGRGEVNVTLAARHAPARSHELSKVIAALENARVAPIGNGLASASSAIHSRLAALDEAFSEGRYSEFEDKLR